MVCRRLPVSLKRRIASSLILFIVISSLIACQSFQSPPIQLVGDPPKQTPYTQPFIQPFNIPIASRVGFIRSPAKPMSPAELKLLDCYTTPDNQQICAAKPVSRLLRSR